VNDPETHLRLTSDAAGYLAGPGGAATHRILLGAGIQVLEGLDLTRVEPGHELVCLPQRPTAATPSRGLPWSARSHEA
jgi:kynurenine formamidase